MPLPRSHVIHPDWQAHHRPVAEDAMTATVNVTRPGTGPGSYDPDTGRTTAPPAAPVYSGPARVQSLNAAADEQLAAEQQVTLHAYRVSLPVGVDARVGDTVTVTDPGPAGDTTLTNRGLRVVDVTRGSLLWQRDLTCTDDLG